MNGGHIGVGASGAARDSSAIKSQAPKAAENAATNATAAVANIADPTSIDSDIGKVSDATVENALSGAELDQMKFGVPAIGGALYA